MTAHGGDVIDVDDINEALGRLNVFNSVSATTSSSAVTAETVLQTLPSKTYLANQAYRLAVRGGYQLSATTAFASFSIRKTNASGTVLFSNLRTSIVGHTNAVGWDFSDVVFQIGSSDVTAVLVLTGTANSTNTVTHVGTATLPRGIFIYWAGAATDYPNAPTLS